MSMNYITKIQANLSRYNTIHTNKVTSCVLDGSYTSVFKGKSMNFDELREYVLGDDVKDIDWKATSRSGKVLVRQYIAEKKHNVLFVFDTNRRMLGKSKDGTEKRELAIMAAGTLALFVNRNTDYIGAIYETENGMQQFPFRTGLANVELALQDYNKSVTMDNRTDVNRALEYIIRNYNRRMVIVIVTDLEGVCKISETNLKRLNVMNDVLMIRVLDAELDGDKLYDLGEDTYLEDFYAKDKKLQKKLKEETAKLRVQCETKLNHFGIACAEIDNLPEMERKINQMLAKHRFEKR